VPGAAGGPAAFRDRPGYATQEIRDAIVYATFKYLQKDVKVSEYLWNWQDLIEGHQLQLTNNADQSRTYLYISMHENTLYVLDATVRRVIRAGLVPAVARLRGQGRQRQSATRPSIRTSSTGCASIPVPPLARVRLRRLPLRPAPGDVRPISSTI